MTDSTMPPDVEAEARQGSSARNGYEKTTVDGNALRDMVFPPITWAVPDLLPAGTCLFGGREKMGKSWLAFGLCIAVATGGVALGSKRVQRGDALYLSLEDGERRLHQRLEKLASPDADLSRLHIATEWDLVDRGGADHLDQWLGEHPETRLVVIDTLKRIRPRTSGRGNLYDDDYDAVRPFVPLGQKHDVAIVLVHHLNQQSNPDDPYDWFSGSAGLVAAAEGILLFRRKRGAADAFLTVDGKDIDERVELAVRWDHLVASWSVIGDAEIHRRSELRSAILEVAENSDEPLGPTEVADILGVPANNVKQRMYQMSKDGELKVVARGKYSIPPHNYNNYNNQHNRHNFHNHGEVTEVMGVTTPHNETDAVAAYLSRPPHWLKKMLSDYSEDPDRFREHLCRAIAAKKLGTPDRWEEVAPILRGQS